MQNLWKSCSSCKSPIPFGGTYYVCSVSTCRQKKTDYIFCTIECWDQHLPVERHRGDDVAAIEKRAPKSSEAQTRRVVVASNSSKKSKASVSAESTTSEAEILVVASKVKKYISERSGMNTSSSAFQALSDHIRSLCRSAIAQAREDGRKTVMDRDFPSV